MQSHYVITKCSEGWLIVANGSMLLICERRKDALRAVRAATLRDATCAATGRPDDHAPHAPHAEAPLAAAS